VLTQIGEALAVLHDGGLVHGDLTTSNLMVRTRDTALVRAAQLRRLFDA
jgi:TP53 regulating kinase and related kinases